MKDEIPHEEAKLPYKPKVGILTISSSRYEAKLKGLSYSDPSGDYIESRFRSAGFTEIERALVNDNYRNIIEAIDNLVRSGCELIVACGGTGVSPSDVSYKALKSIITDELTMYPILFALYSFEEISSRLLSTRLIAGFYKDSLIFLAPGSLNAVKVALDNIILKEYEHILWLRRYGKL